LKGTARRLSLRGPFFRQDGQDFLFGSYPARHIAVGERRKIPAEVQLHYVVSNKLSAGKPIALLIGQPPGPAHQFGGDANGIRLAIGGSL
jgi:hypothetical protein